MEKRKVRTFILQRHNDVSGVSGTGQVAIGVELPSGKCVLEWVELKNSVSIYDDVESVIEIHGHGGSTDLVWLDE